MLILWSKYLTFFEKLLFRNFPIFVLFEELVIQNQNLCSAVAFKALFDNLIENLFFFQLALAHERGDEGLLDCHLLGIQLLRAVFCVLPAQTEANNREVFC